MFSVVSSGSFITVPFNFLADEGTFGQVMKASLECGRGKGEEEEVVAVKLVKGKC